MAPNFFKYKPHAAKPQEGGLRPADGFPTLPGMTLLVGLILVTLLLLSFGHGMLAAYGLWGLALAYVLMNTAPNMTFALWLSLIGLAAFVIQLGVNLGGEEKKK